jgi:translin
VDESITIVRLISEIYSRLRYLDYPDSLVPGFKHKVDVMRRALEDLETLLVDVKSRRELISEIGSLKEKLRT